MVVVCSNKFYLKAKGLRTLERQPYCQIIAVPSVVTYRGASGLIPPWEAKMMRHLQ